MGYFKSPVRRAAARKAKRAHNDAGRDVGTWTEVERDFRTKRDQFVRFAIEYRNGTHVGLFQSNRLIEDDVELPAALRSGFRATVEWFNQRMKVPRRLPRNAVCWFRASAVEHVKQMRLLAEFYRAADVRVLMQTSSTPGRVVYQDDVQIAAVPHRDRRHAVRKA